MADGYVLLDGVDDFIDTPDFAAFPTGDFELRIEFQADFGEEFAVVNKYGAVGTRSMRVRWTTATPDVQLLVYADGSTVDFQRHSDAVILAGRVQIRITQDADNGSGSKVITFYQRPPGNTLSNDDGWTQISTHTIAGTTSIFDGNADFSIGQLVSGAETYMHGKVWEMLLWSDLSKTTLVADPNFRDESQAAWSTGSGTDGAGRTWTLQNGAVWVPGDPRLHSGKLYARRGLYSELTLSAVT